MKTIEELSKDTFYKMQNYSQLVIDLVSDVEDLFMSESNHESVGCLSYDVDNILEVIDKDRIHDVKALKLLSKILRNEIKEPFKSVKSSEIEKQLYKQSKSKFEDKN
jgi:hypothetical protein